MKRKFYIGVGIENCWMAQTDYPGTRLLDVFLQMQHYDKWQEDLQLAKELGTNAIRYSVPWYRSNPSPGNYDWDWIAEPLDWLVDNGITPVIDLIHYGTPIWMDNGVLNSQFPELFAEYAHAFARRFDGIVDHYTPMNEPQLSASKSGYDAVWPPYLHGVDGFCTVCLPLARAIVMASRALRDACVHCCLISAECNSAPVYKILATEAGLPELELGSTVYHRLFPASLSYGKILPDNPLVRVLRRMGYADDDFQWFLEHAEPPDILGYNYYPDLETITPVEARVRLLRYLTEAHAGFGLPVYITETSSGLDDEKKIQWVRALGELCKEAREQELPVFGINWWPLFETIQWDYRVNGKSVEDCIVPGGWNNGLYVVNKEPGASLGRIPTGAVAEFRTLCADLLGNAIA
jgi:beta-glucosidase/6-phospho-beta-glucosidase/beta-galactosidase